MEHVEAVQMHTEESREAVCRLQGDGAIGVSHLKNPGIDGRKSYIRLLSGKLSFPLVGRVDLFAVLVINDNANDNQHYHDTTKDNLDQDTDGHDCSSGYSKDLTDHVLERVTNLQKIECSSAGKQEKWLLEDLQKTVFNNLDTLHTVVNHIGKSII